MQSNSLAAMKQNSKGKVIFLFGPTAVGKTALLFNIFNRGFEVINADSVQVYRRLDIGSAKVTAEERAAIPHHLVDIREPWESFCVGDFVSLADEAADEIRSRGNVPVICGGTAYYFKHFLYGLSKSPKSDPRIRASVKAMLEEKGARWCHEELGRLDAQSAARIHPNDVYRITRALEVCMSGEGRLSDFAVPSTVRDGMEVLILGLTRPKPELDERIARRVDMMFDDGLVEEIEGLVRLGASSEWPSMKAIGYHEFLTAIDSAKAAGCTDCNLAALDIEAVKQSIVMDSIHYAKRQKVFFQSFSDVIWLNPETDEGRMKALVDEFLKG